METSLYSHHCLGSHNNSTVRAGWLEFDSTPGRDRGFSCHCIPTGSGIHPAYYPMSTGGSVSRGKAVRVWCWQHIPV